MYQIHAWKAGNILPLLTAYNLIDVTNKMLMLQKLGYRYIVAQV